MLSDETQSAATTVNAGVNLPREVEFAQALDRYMTGYIAEQQRRLQRPRLNGPFLRVRRLCVEALERLGGAMSGGGRFPSVGVM